MSPAGFAAGLQPCPPAALPLLQALGRFFQKISLPLRPRPSRLGPEGPIVRKCTVRPRISDLKSPQDCLCLTVLHACLAVAGSIACNHGMQMELPGLSAAVLPH